jgi:ribosomal protein S27E
MSVNYQYTPKTQNTIKCNGCKRILVIDIDVAHNFGLACRHCGATIKK